MLGRLLDLCRRHIIKTTFVMAGIEGIVFYVWWLSAGSGTFLTPTNYIFVCLGIFIASSASLYSLFSSINAMHSLNATRESLDLTRKTQRPFLKVDQFDVRWSRNDGQSTSVENFIFGLCNTGSFPANQVSVLMKVSKNNIDNQQHLFSDNEGIPTICFPSDEIHNRRFRRVDEKEKLEVELKGELRVRIEIEYRNKLTQETHKTKQSYLIQYNPNARHDPTPLPGEDYWD